MAKRIFSRKNYRIKISRIFRRPVLKIIGLVFLILLLAAILIPATVFIYYAKDLPRPEKFTELSFPESTKIYDRTGAVLLYEIYGEEKREIIPLSDMPDNLKNAVIVAEDANFYSHFGIDLKGIARSILDDIKSGSLTSGGSTISQQLIRSTFLTGEKTISRKVREIVLTLELERRYPKDQILEWYLNEIPFGPNIYGVEAASKTFFGKSAKELSVNEAATLAAVIRAPSYLFPYGSHQDELIQRKNYILDRLAEKGYLSVKDAEASKKEEVKFSQITQSIKAPHFVFYIQDYLFEKYGKDFLEKGGLKIYTTLDWNLQQLAEKDIAAGVARNKKYNGNNSALVAIDPKTGEILSMVGSADWFGESFPKGCKPGIDCLFDPKVNVATYQQGRQPGSAFKPFVYATAFEKGFNDKTIVVDEETNFGIWGGKPYIPRNYDGLFRGPVTLRSALACSLNIPAVKVLAYLAGQHDSLQTAKKMGITTLIQPDSYYGLAIVLGGGEVKLLDITSAYGVFANDGVRVPATGILKIEDTQGNIIEENKKNEKRVLSQETSRLISDILSDNNARTPIFGPGSPLYFENYQVAAKTGTTSDYRDGWIIGYTPSLVVGVWSGNNNNAAMYREPGIVLSGLTWRDFMNQVLPLFPKEDFIKPESAPPPSPTPAPQ